MSIILKNRDLVDCWLSAPHKNREAVLQNFVFSKVGLLDLDKNDMELKVHYFHYKMKENWKASNYSRDRFEQIYFNWLNWIFWSSNDEHSKENVEPPIKRGRPTKPFQESSVTSKNRRISELLEKYSLEELEYAIEKLKRKESRPEKMISPSKALSLYMDLDLSESKYKVLREVINSVHDNCLPSLYAIQIEKKKILPSFTSSEVSAEVNLNSLLCSTAERVIDLCNDEEIGSKLTLVCKWGMDGSSSHSRYKQKFTDAEKTDEFIFFVAFVPLQLINLATNQAIWTNTKPSSPSFCRPIKFFLEKENPRIVIEQYELITKEVEGLKSEIVVKGGKSIQVSFKMHCTMIDGAVTNILSDTNCSSRCFICNASPKEMNNIEFTKDPNADNYKFGLSTLHCWIRFLDCVLHISYRLSFRKWRVGKENKFEFLENKKRVQDEFKKNTGLIIDQVKHGFGTTNDGNTARRFFADSDTAAKITGVNKELIERFYIILRVLSCGYPINKERFQELLTSTRDLYLLDYDWFFMPSSVHKVLIHGCDVINYFDLPIGINIKIL